MFYDTHVNQEIMQEGSELDHYHIVGPFVLGEGEFGIYIWNVCIYVLRA